MQKFLKWLENLWNLRLIFDKYLPMLRELYAEVSALKNAEIEAEAETNRTNETEK